MAMLVGLILFGLGASALLGVALFHNSLLDYFTLIEALGLSLSLTFIFFSGTLLYLVVIGSNAIDNERDCLFAALAVTTLSFGIDLGYCYFGQLTLGDFVTALILLYAFFLACFLLARVREIKR